MAVSPSQPPARAAQARWPLALVGLVLVLLSHPWMWFAGRQELLFPAVGLGLALTAWLGYRAVLAITAELLLIQTVFRPEGVTILQAAGDALLVGGEIALAWWCYRRAGGARRLTDPQSATLFLVLVPGVIVSGFAVLRVLNRHGLPQWENFGPLIVDAWMADALGIVAVAPPLLAVVTPWLVHYGLAEVDPSEQRFAIHPRLTWTVGDVLETVGLAIGAGVVGLAVAALHAREPSTNWQLWGVLLLVIVWASLRLGLRGGTLVAATATLLAVLLGSLLMADTPLMHPLCGHLLAQCCTALLIGSSADWIRASEARYRQIVGHIPVVLYSARFLRMPGPGIKAEVEVLLVSPATRQVFGCEAEALTGNYRAWLDRVHEEDRELLQAALSQLLLQNQPLTCEYRLAEDKAPPQRAANGTLPRSAANPLLNLARTTSLSRYVRDTLVPHHGADGQLDGWEGVVEDITEQRQLAHDLRRTTNMLHAVVSHLPTGVYFVHGINGQPLLVNTRARQLLGQREDLAAGLAHLADVYRLHRPDGRPYPWQELPVAKALREGATCMCDDIIVHRPDGRRVPLVTWAAPVDLGGHGSADAAVWVLEDLTALRQAESARQETELRLRAVIETMAEGLVVQDPAGVIVECNPAACAILGTEPDQLRGWSALVPEGRCLREDGTPLPRDQQPDRVSLNTGQPVRGVVIGIVPEAERGEKPAVRWILANSMPLSLTDKLGDSRGRRVVTTFADITAHRQALEVLRLSEEQYRGLIESLPLMVLQFGPSGSLDYHNPAVEEVSGFAADALAAPGFWQRQIHPDDAAAFTALLDAAADGQRGRAEIRYRAADGAEKVGYALAQPRRPAGATVLLVDMTQRRQLEQELQQAQRLELAGKIASGIAHDFNNYLTVIFGYADLVRQALGEHPARDDVQHIFNATEQARRLARQLLTLSKPRQVVMRPVDLRVVTSEAVELVRPTLPGNIDLELRGPAEPLEVLADDSPLQQVVMNLCLNARDAMPQGGRLTVETTLESLVAGDATVAAAPAATGGVRAWARLSVSDTGAGMSDEVRGRLFEPLFTTKANGSGLGLAVVKQIVEGFGGCIRVSSTPGEGSRFDVWLPARVA